MIYNIIDYLERASNYFKRKPYELCLSRILESLIRLYLRIGKFPEWEILSKCKIVSLVIDFSKVIYQNRLNIFSKNAVIFTEFLRD